MSATSSPYGYGSRHVEVSAASFDYDLIQIPPPMVKSSRIGRCWLSPEDMEDLGLVSGDPVMLTISKDLEQFKNRIINGDKTTKLICSAYDSKFRGLQTLIGPDQVGIDLRNSGCVMLPSMPNENVQNTKNAKAAAITKLVGCREATSAILDVEGIEGKGTWTGRYIQMVKKCLLNLYISEGAEIVFDLPLFPDSDKSIDKSNSLFSFKKATFRVSRIIPSIQGIFQISTRTRITIKFSGKTSFENDNLVSNKIDVNNDGDGNKTTGVGGNTFLLSYLKQLIFFPIISAKVYDDTSGDVQKEFEIPRGIILSGPPGVGKTFTISEVVKQCNGKVFDSVYVEVKAFIIMGSELLQYGMGESESRLHAIFEDAHNFSSVQEKHRIRCSIIFLDEMDAICAKRDEQQSSQTSRIVGQLLTLLDGISTKSGNKSHVITIGATNRPNVLDPALRRPGRFDKEIYVSPPDAVARSDILRKITSKMIIEENIDFDTLAKECVGYIPADLVSLSRAAAMEALRRRSKHIFADSKGYKISASENNMSERITDEITLSDFRRAMETVGASSLRGQQVATVTNVTWHDIGGQSEVKSKLQQAVEWPLKYPEQFRRMNISPPRGILLYGPPGCSKTTLVKALANSTNTSFITLSGADVYSAFVGEAEATVRRAFTTARASAPSILFFDEIDAIVGDRGSSTGTQGSGEAEARVLSTFLNEMDGVDVQKVDGVLIVGATNRPNSIDKALLRPGRFDQVIYVPPPDLEAREHIFSIHTKNIPLHDDVDLKHLAQKTDGFTGAEIEGLCREAALLTLRQNFDDRSVSIKHFMDVIEDSKPMLTPEMLALFNKIEK